MKLIHRNCGGLVIESKNLPPYSSTEYGIIPAYICDRCNLEILGDVQTEFIVENEADKIQIEAFNEVGK